MISRRDRRRSVASVVNTKSRSESRAIERRKTKQKDLEKQLLRLKEQEKKRQERHKYKLQHMTKREKDSRRKGHKARFLENIVNASYDRDMEADISEKHNLNEDSSILDVNTEEFIVNSGRSMGDMLHGVVEAARIQREMEEAKTEAERLRRERENMERYNKPVHLKELDEENKLASLNFDKPSVEVEMMKTEFHSAVKRGRLA